jgi:hypothetical protein
MKYRNKEYQYWEILFEYGKPTIVKLFGSYPCTYIRDKSHDVETYWDNPKLTDKPNY